MDFATLVSPLSLDEFAAKALANETFVMPGAGRRDFHDLISLEEIELVLNNGCNVNSPMQVIMDGGRQVFLERNIVWSPFALDKSQIKQRLTSGHSFMVANMSQISPKVAALIDEIERYLEGTRADMHLYVSLMDKGTGYSAHRDRPHKIYLQVVGSTLWQTFSHNNTVAEDIDHIVGAEEDRYLTREMEFTLEPGDVLFMPPRTFHKVRNHFGPRISFSIPFYVNQNGKNKRMDRTFIPFRSLFDDALQKAASELSSTGHLP